MNRITVLQNIINQKRAKTYLEIGVQEGHCFLKINARKKYGVDPQFLLSRKKLIKSYLNNFTNLFNKYYKITSDDFFRKKAKNLPFLDVVLIDGLHTYEQSLKDVLNSLDFLKENGVIVMHDCNPSSELAAFPAKSIIQAEKKNLEKWTGTWSGDVWKTIVHLRSTNFNLNIFVLDCDYGLGIIMKGNTKNLLDFSPNDIKKLNYYDLDNNRVKLLNLKKPEYFINFVSKELKIGNVNTVFFITQKINEILLKIINYIFKKIS